MFYRAPHLFYQYSDGDTMGKKTTSRDVTAKRPRKKRLPVQAHVKIYCGGTIIPHHDWRSRVIDKYPLHRDVNRLVVLKHFKCTGWYPDQDQASRQIAIKDANLVFIWVALPEDPEALFDIKTAYQYGKQTAIIYPTQAIADASPTIRAFRYDEFCLETLQAEARDPAVILYRYLQWHGAYCQSPLETRFWLKARSVLQGVEMQYPIHADGHEYNVDFAIPSAKLIVEIDGFKYHQRDRDAFVAEKKRWRDIQALGWKIIPFAGREIKDACGECVAFVLREVTH